MFSSFGATIKGAPESFKDSLESRVHLYGSSQQPYLESLALPVRFGCLVLLPWLSYTISVAIKTLLALASDEATR